MIDVYFPLFLLFCFFQHWHFCSFFLTDWLTKAWHWIWIAFSFDPDYFRLLSFLFLRNCRWSRWSQSDVFFSKRFWRSCKCWETAPINCWFFLCFISQWFWCPFLSVLWCLIYLFGLDQSTNTSAPEEYSNWTISNSSNHLNITNMYLCSSIVSCYPWDASNAWGKHNHISPFRSSFLYCLSFGILRSRILCSTAKVKACIWWIRSNLCHLSWYIQCSNFSGEPFLTKTKSIIPRLNNAQCWKFSCLLSISVKDSSKIWLWRLLTHLLL